MSRPVRTLLFCLVLIFAHEALAATDVHVAFTLATADTYGAPLTENRDYYVYRPDNLPKTTPVPMVLVMEGAAATFFHRKADQNGFVVVSCTFNGNSLGNVWNNDNPRITGFEDYDYTAAVIDRVAASDNCTDAFICGLSKGGHMSYAFACERPDKIRAACSVDEFMGLTSNLPVAPVPILALHGTLDTNVPYTMGKDSVDAWRAMDGLMRATPTTTYESSPLLPGRVTQTSWRGGVGGTQVAFVTIVGGTHQWPVPTGLTGYDSTDGIWTFFSQFLTSTQPAPKIVAPPVNNTQLSGQPASFWVGATGSGPLSYQWQKNGVNIAGATANWITLPAVAADDNGATFRAVVTNALGSATSPAATLTVAAAPADPAITTQPTDQLAFAGQPANFSVMATGSGPLRYQWRKNGVNLVGATATSLAVPATLTVDSGATFSVVVTSNASSTTSAAGTLTVLPAPGAPVVLASPQRSRVLVGQTGSFSVTATSAAPMTYQWQKGTFTTNMADIAGANSATYTTPVTTLLDHLSIFRCVVSNAAGSATSATEMLFVTSAATPPTDITSAIIAGGAPGVPFSYSITSSGGTAPVSFNASPLPAGLSVDATTGAISGTPPATGTTNITLTATNSAGSFSRTLALTIDPVPVITAQPIGASVAVGQSASLTVSATASPAPTYQWQMNGRNLNGATNALLTLANIQPTNAGLYTAIVTNGAASVSSDPVLIGISSVLKLVGPGAEIAHGVFVASNGNTFDQILPSGPAVAVTAEPGKITRTSFIDLTDDIVQVEFTGNGTLSLVLDNASGPALPLNYNQNTPYMKGHAGIVITGADDTSNVSVFSVGRVTAFDPTGAFNSALPISATNTPANNGNPIFHGHSATIYDGTADLAFIAIASVNGKFGGVRTANGSYYATKGLTGVYAPGVQFTGPVYVGDINASGSASPVLVLGSATNNTWITGGDLFQANGQPVKVSGITQVKFTDGTTSGGALLPAQPIQGRLTQNGVDVTSQLATTASVSAKKFHPGHYMMLNIGSTAAQQRPLIAQNATDPNIAGFQICYTWAQLETGQGNYGGIDSTIASDLAYVAQFGKQLVVQLQYKSKSLGDFPVDLQSVPGAFVQGFDGYYVPNLWDPSVGVLGRYLTLLQQIAAKCDAHPSLEIVNLAESATVDAATTLGGTYTAASWVNALKTIAQTAAAFKTTTFEEYINHISGDDSLVGAACANAIAAGCTFGGPDIDPSRNNIPAYDYYAQYAATAHLGSAVQPMDYGLTGAFWFDSDHSQTTEHLFGFATSSRLYVSYIYWLNSNADLNWRSAKTTIDAHPWPWYGL